MLDCAPLDRYLTEAEAAVGFVRRTGSEHAEQVLDPYRWLAGVLLGESTAAAGEAVSADKYAGHPLAQFLLISVMRPLPPSSAIRPAWPARHTAAAMLLVPLFPGLYPTGVARLLRGLALAGQARDADADTRGGLLAELDEVTRWLAARAADAPGNFLHLLRLVEAEAGVGGRGFPRRRPGLRRRPARGRPAAASLAPGADRRARRPVLSRPRPGACLP